MGRGSGEVAEERQLLLYWAFAPEADSPYDPTLSEDDFRRRAAGVQRLQMFMHNCADLSPLCDFVGLRELVVSLQSIPRLSGLQNCCALERLVLTEVKLERIYGLAHCTALRQLDLSRNRLRRIEGLETLAGLETLWLCENAIPCIEGLNAQRRLRSLWLARNRIRTIGESLDALPQLEELNVAANLLGTFRDIANLARLRRLRALSLADPHYGPSPLCSLFNYATYCLYHLPQLRALDKAAVSDDARALADGTYRKKRLFYSMRIKGAYARFARADAAADGAARARAAELLGGLEAVARQRAAAARDLADRAGAAVPPPPLAGAGAAGRDAHVHALGALGAAAGPAGAQVAAKLAALDRAAEGQAAALHALDALHALVRARAASARDGCVCRLVVELESGGNIRMEEAARAHAAPREGAAADGAPPRGEVWSASCAELVASRFYARDYAHVGVTGVTVTSVTRVHNRELRARFDEALEAAGEGGGGAKGDGAGAAPFAARLEYLFARPPPLPDALAAAAAAAAADEDASAPADAAGRAEDGSIMRVAELGFELPAETDAAAATPPADADGGAAAAPARAGRAEPACAFSNSFGLADRARLEAALREAAEAAPDASPAAVRAALRARGGLCGRLLVCKAHLGCAHAEDPARTAAAGGRVRARDYPGADSVYRASADDGGQREWFLFGADAALLEYVLDFEYDDAPAGHAGRDDDDDDDAAPGAEAARASEAAERQRVGAETDGLALAAVGGVSVLELGGLARPLGTLLAACARAQAAAALAAAEPAAGARGARGLALDAEVRAACALPPAGLGAERAPPPLADPAAVGPSAAGASLEALAEAAARGRPQPTHLDLQGLRLRSVDALCASPRWARVESLALADNALAALPDLASLPLLTALDLSRNALATLGGALALRATPRLASLDLSANRLASAADVVELGAAVGVGLRRLWLLGNPLCGVLGGGALGGAPPAGGYRRLALGACAALVELDGVAVGAAERRDAAAAVARGAGLAVAAPAAPAAADGSSLADGALQRLAYARYLPSVAFAHTAARPRTIAQLLEAGAPLSVSLPPAADDGAADAPADAYAGAGADADADADADAGWAACVEQLELCAVGLRLVPALLARFGGLRALNLSRNAIASLGGGGCALAAACPLLVDLRLDGNGLRTLDGLGALTRLQRLELGRNELESLEPLAELGASLGQLGVEANRLRSLRGVGGLVGLMEVYAPSNRLGALAELGALRELPKLLILDLSDNPLCAAAEYRLCALYQLRKLKVLDGAATDAAEQAEARERYDGRLTHELLVERTAMAPTNWALVKRLDLSSAKLRELSLLTPARFPHLLELSCASNQISTLASLAHLPSLVALSLAGNALGAALGARGGAAPGAAAGAVAAAAAAAEARALERLGGVSVRLERLDLSANGLADLDALPLRELGALRVLRLGSNELGRLPAGAFDALRLLRELSLERNRIRTIAAGALASLDLLLELRLDDNALRTLDNLGPLPALELLTLSGNRLGELAELERLAHLGRLRSLSLQSNVVSRKPLYRATLIRRLPALETIDGKPVSADERERVEIVFAPDPNARALAGAGAMPGAGALGIGAQQLGAVGRVALKVTAMSFNCLQPSMGAVGGGAQQGVSGISGVAFSALQPASGTVYGSALEPQSRHAPSAAAPLQLGIGRPQPRTVDERAELVAFATGTAIRKGSLAPGPGAARPGSHSRPARGNLGPSDRGGPSSLHEPVLGGTTNTLNSRRFV